MDVKNDSWACFRFGGLLKKTLGLAEIKILFIVSGDSLFIVSAIVVLLYLR